MVYKVKKMPIHSAKSNGLASVLSFKILWSRDPSTKMSRKLPTKGQKESINIGLFVFGSG